MNRETAIMRNIRMSLNRTRRCRLVRNNTGFDTTTNVRYGLGVGGADLVGMLPTGRLFCLEVKTDSGKTTDEQQAWLATVRKWGGFAGIVRSVEEARAALERAERGASE